MSLFCLHTAVMSLLLSVIATFVFRDDWLKKVEKVFQENPLRYPSNSVCTCNLQSSSCGKVSGELKSNS